MHRRSLLRAGLGLAAAGICGRAARADWAPARTITVVVPYPAGGGTDVLARLLARSLAAELGGGASAIVENLPGASGAIGSRKVARAEPDGHTILVTTNQTHATNVSLLKEGGGYDPVRDFTVLGGLADLQHLLVVRKEFPARTVPEFVAAARAGQLTCASTGIGSASHLAMELFKTRVGVSFVHVPYRGAAPLLQDMIGGRVDLAFATVPTVLGQVQAGELRALAVASPTAVPQLPEVPTLASRGIAGVEADAWIAAFAPARLPATIRDRYAGLMKAALGGADVAAALKVQGMLADWRDPDAFASFQRADIDRWAAIIREAGVKVE